MVRFNTICNKTNVFKERNFSGRPAKKEPNLNYLRGNVAENKVKDI